MFPRSARVTDDDSLGFRLYHAAGAPGAVLATQITEENIGPLTKVVKGFTLHGRLHFQAMIDRGMPDHVGEIGDYVISDMGGLYIPIEKELFELHYNEL